MPLPARGFNAVSNRRFAPGDPHIHASSRIRRLMRWFPRGFVHDTFDRFVAFPPRAVVAVADADELIAVDFDQRFGSWLPWRQFRTRAHRAPDTYEYMFAICTEGRAVEVRSAVVGASAADLKSDEYDERPNQRFAQLIRTIRRMVDIGHQPNQVAL
jgi:hypothetical protein